MEETVTQIKIMYVLLDRIGGLENCCFDGMDISKQKGEFLRIFQSLLSNQSINEGRPEEFLTMDEVLYGTITADDRKYQMVKLKLNNREPTHIQGETLLHRAISLLSTDKKINYDNLIEIIDYIVKNTTLLLKEMRERTDYVGQTPLHLAVLKEDVKLVRRISEKMEKNKITLDTVATGDKFQGTVMMAGSALCVAALKLNNGIFKVLANRETVNMFSENNKKENVCHSLIRYAVYRPDKLDRICKMLDYILMCKWKKEKSSDDIMKTQKLLTMTNKDGLNPLQLATRYHLHQIFRQLFDYEVYCCSNTRDNLLEDKKYDISEIETISPDETGSANESGDDSKQRKQNGSVRFEIDEEKKTQHFSVLPAILLQDPQSAFFFLEFPPVRQVIEGKWHAYRKGICIWGIFHLLIICLVTASAVERSKLRNGSGNGPYSTQIESPEFMKRVTKDEFVTVVSVIALLTGIMYLILEGMRIYVGKIKTNVKEISFLKQLSFPHSNAVYRLLFISFSLSVIIDFILAVSQFSWYENYFLIVAVISGWYLTLFFLQMIKPFSFFTSLIQTVTLDLVKFAIVMLVMLLAFTTAMFMVMQGANTGDETFETYHSALVKMLSIMLGIGDLDGLVEARQPVAAIVVFLLFVLLTTILLLNALIAIMSNTCSELLSGFGNVSAYILHYRLQKLSAILLIEDVIPCKALKTRVGQVEIRQRYVGDNLHDVQRCMVRHTALAAPDENESDIDFKNMFMFIRQSFSIFHHKKRDAKHKRVRPAKTKEFDRTSSLRENVHGSRNFEITNMEARQETVHSHQSPED